LAIVVTFVSSILVHTPDAASIPILWFQPASVLKFHIHIVFVDGYNPSTTPPHTHTHNTHTHSHTLTHTHTLTNKDTEDRLLWFRPAANTIFQICNHHTHSHTQRLL
jgi:hypothetical protein